MEYDKTMAIADQVMHIFSENELSVMESLGLLELMKHDVINSLDIDGSVYDETA